jgi:uncharacterized protein
MLQEKINSELKDAMMKKETVKLNVIRGIKSAITNELVAKGRKPTDELTDEEVVAVIVRIAKQRKDSIEQFTKGGRMDLAANEEEELLYLGPYLPQLMSRDEVEVVAMSKKAEMNITDKTQQGKLMAEVMKELKGKADGAMVKQVVDALF